MYIYIYIYIYIFSEKNPVLPGSNARPNVAEGYEVTSELPGRPVLYVCMYVCMYLLNCT